MKTYQIKVTVKKSKPPVWKRCLVPSGITFSQMALILDEIMEETPDNGYEFEFYQAGIHLREWTGEENTVRKYNFDYMCASDTYVDSLMDNEEWFTFRSGNGDRQYRAEIEKRTAQEICYPSVIKQKESSGIQEWMDMEVMNRELEQLFRLRSAEPDCAGYEELRQRIEAGNNGLDRTDTPVSRTEHNVKCTDSRLKEMAGLLRETLASDLTAKIMNEIFDSETGETVDQEKMYNSLDDAAQQMRRTIRDRMFGYKESEGESRKPDIIEYLKDATRDELKEMAEDLELKHYKSQNKETLAERIKEEILKPDVMEKRMLLLSDDEIEAFEHAIEKKGGYYPSYREMETLDRLYALSYVISYADDYAEVPEEAAHVYEEINTPEFQRRRQETFWMYHSLLFTELLYGSAPVKVIQKMMRKCLGRQLNREKIGELFHSIPEKLNPCVMRDDKVIFKEILREDLYLKVEASQEGKDFYIPTAWEIQDYTENGYPTRDPHYRRLKGFLAKKMKLNADEAEDLMPVIWGKVSMGAGMSDIMEIFDNIGAIFPSEDAVREFVQIMTDVNNNTRMLSNRGYTPNEIVQMMPQTLKGKLPTIVPMSSAAADMLKESAGDLKKMGFGVDLDSNADEIPVAAMPNGISGKTVTGSRKIYPNDPCPCGSGKKYKKCCGRNK